MSTEFVLFISMHKVAVYRGFHPDSDVEVWCELDSNQDPIVFSSMEKAIDHMSPFFSANDRHVVTLEEFEMMRVMMI